MPRFCLAFKKWRRSSVVAIEKVFGKEEYYADEFRRINFSPSVTFSGMPDSIWQDQYAKGLQSAEAMLESMIEEIEEYWDDCDETQATFSSSKNVQSDPKKVFLVHGRDSETKLTVARFLEQLNLEPVILEELASRGRTIIEKFEDNAGQVGYAVVLFTPDDEGRLGESGAEYSPRARQNVVFELGYFAGALGRKHVCALIKGNVEKPSDYDGVVYIPYDNSGGWKLSLVRELKEAGLNVDANLAL